MLCCVCGGIAAIQAGDAAAAENLAPLRVDPALLGLKPVRPKSDEQVTRPSSVESKDEAKVESKVDSALQPEVVKAQTAPKPALATPTDAGPRRAPEPTPAPARAESSPAPAVQGSGLALPVVPRREQTRNQAPAQTVVIEPPMPPVPSKPAQTVRPLESLSAPQVPPLVAPALAAPAPTQQVAPEERDVLPPLALRTTPRLTIKVPQAKDEKTPIFISADRISGRSGNEVKAEGKVELRRIGTTLKADQLTYWQNEDEAEAAGNVRINQNDDSITGPKVRLKLGEQRGFFEEPSYVLQRTPKPGQSTVATTGSGAAKRLDFEGEGVFRLTDSTYSTCSPGNYDWYAQTGSLLLDYNQETGEARDVKLMFLGMPLLYTPWINFSLNNKRKSGLLPPTFGSSSRTGTELTTPFYWNIAPDIDATISPRFMTRRGLQMNGEFRYLDPNYSGILHGEYLPDDKVAGKTRSAYSVLHSQNFGHGLTGSLKLNGVSDDTYFTDLSTRATVTSQSQLLRQGVLSYDGGWWSATARAQRYQTLQDPSLPPLTIPYDRLPQLTLNANRPDVFGAALAFTSEYVDFGHPTQVTGKRIMLYPQFSLPLQMQGFYVTPKIGYHMTRYSLERQAMGTPDRLSRSLPIFSVDSGVTFERDMEWQGRNLTQTLEPRLYYLNVPNRKQDLIPNFDSAQANFNFAQIFSENIFVGGDRIADANQLTAALTSRLIDPATGAELLRGMIGQRYYFRNQSVTLPGVPARTEKSADLLAAVSGRIAPKTYIDTAWQYNPRDSRTERLTLGGRYQPDVGRVLNASYRFNRDLLREVDVSGQWPLGGNWHGVGRYNYSLREHRLIEAIGGLEYDGGCWVTRFVVQRFATNTGKTNTALFLQLELNGFSQIGSNPLELLKRNIPGYGLINQSTASPVFGAD